jgi:hypothetical protein
MAQGIADVGATHAGQREQFRVRRRTRRGRGERVVRRRRHGLVAGRLVFQRAGVRAAGEVGEAVDLGHRPRRRQQARLARWRRILRLRQRRGLPRPAAREPSQPRRARGQVFAGVEPPQQALDRGVQRCAFRILARRAGRAVLVPFAVGGAIGR